MSTERTEMTDQDQKRLDEIKREEHWKADIAFTSAEEFCSKPGEVFCSKKLNEEARGQAIPRLKYMASVMCIVDHFRTHIRKNKDALGWRGQLPDRTYDLSNGEDVMALSSYFPYKMQHLFLMNMELIADRCFD
jgi:hypothetical protein